MAKPKYRLFNENIAETIRNEISRLRDALLFGSKENRPTVKTIKLKKSIQATPCFFITKRNPFS